MGNQPIGRLEHLTEFFMFLREFNIYASAIVFLGCLFRLVKIFTYWKALSKDNLLYSKLNIEKMACWFALASWSFACFAGSWSHQVYNSDTGIFIPLNTLSLALTVMGIFFARKLPGLPFKQKDIKDD